MQRWLEPPQAAGARTALVEGPHRDPGPELDPGHSGAELVDHTAELVAQRDGTPTAPRALAEVHVEVTATDAVVCDLDPHLALAGRGLVDGVETDVLEAVQSARQHRR